MKKKDPTSHRIIEKRRRDRMNNCLADLSKLIPPHYMKKGRGRIEKTEIIEMAIRHLKDLIELSNAKQQNGLVTQVASVAMAQQQQQQQQQHHYQHHQHLEQQQQQQANVTILQEEGQNTKSISCASSSSQPAGSPFLVSKSDGTLHLDHKHTCRSDVDLASSKSVPLALAASKTQQQQPLISPSIVQEHTAQSTAILQAPKTVEVLTTGELQEEHDERAIFHCNQHGAGNLVAQASHCCITTHSTQQLVKVSCVLPNVGLNTQHSASTINRPYRNYSHHQQQQQQHHYHNHHHHHHHHQNQQKQVKCAVQTRNAIHLAGNGGANVCCSATSGGRINNLHQHEASNLHKYRSSTSKHHNSSSSASDSSTSSTGSRSSGGNRSNGNSSGGSSDGHRSPGSNSNSAKYSSSGATGGSNSQNNLLVGGVSVIADTSAETDPRNINRSRGGGGGGGRSSNSGSSSSSSSSMSSVEDGTGGDDLAPIVRNCSSARRTSSGLGSSTFEMSGTNRQVTNLSIALANSLKNSQMPIECCTCGSMILQTLTVPRVNHHHHQQQTMTNAMTQTKDQSSGSPNSQTNSSSIGYSSGSSCSSNKASRGDSNTGTFNSVLGGSCHGNSITDNSSSSSSSGSSGYEEISETRDKSGLDNRDNLSGHHRTMNESSEDNPSPPSSSSSLSSSPTSSTSSSSSSSSSCSMAWYKKAWLLRSFSRSHSNR